MNNDTHDKISIAAYSFFGLLLIVISFYGMTHWANVKPAPKFANTLQRDINP